MTRHVFYISDRTGITVEAVGESVLAQFSGVQFERTTLRFIDSEDKAGRAAQAIRRQAQASGLRPIVFTTLVDPAVRHVIAESGGMIFDIVDSFAAPLATELGQTPAQRIGHTHGAIDLHRYTQRMEAVNFALSSDDGLGTDHYSQADVIVLGVSRSGKTPTCLYLALTYGVYAANYPLTADDLSELRLPAALKAHRGKLFGLCINAHRLSQIRNERRPDAPYSSLRQCQLEERQAEALYRQEGIPHLAITTMSVEEIAATLLEQATLPRRTI